MANDRSATVKGCTFKRMLVLVRAASLHCQSRPPYRANDNPISQAAPFECLWQSWKVSALVDPRMPAQLAHMLVIRIMS